MSAPVDAKVVILGQGRIVMATIDPPLPPITRAQLFAMLLGARTVLATITTPTGGAYRLDLVRRIDEAILREPRS